MMGRLWDQLVPQDPIAPGHTGRLIGETHPNRWPQNTRHCLPRRKRMPTV